MAVLNPKNITNVKNTKIKSGISPDFSDEEFSFIRVTEHFFTIAIWQRDSEEQ